MLGNYLKTGLSEPMAGLKYLSGGRNSVMAYKIAKLLGAKESDVVKIQNEITGDKEFRSRIMNALADANTGEVSSPETLYVICRLLGPQTVVETGVASGVSSAYILKALERNGFGKLYSIDMPNYDLVLARRGEKIYSESESLALVPKEKGSGYVIPEELRRRWGLRLGLTKDLLPQLVEELGSVDVFMHDSEHTYENMNFEYRTVWPHIRDGGLLLTHDAGWSTAFSELCSSVEKTPIYIHFSDIAGIRK